MCPVKGDRFAYALVAVAVASAFGPYLSGGIRTEQLVIYGMTAWMLCIAPWTWLRLRPTALATNLTVAWGLYAAVGLIGAMGAPLKSVYLPGSLFAGADNLLLPLASMWSMWLLVTPERREKALQVACATLAWCTALNGVLAIIGTRKDLGFVLRPFWGSSDVIGLTVAERAAQMGRFSGVFNQPAEAGLMYGLAGLAAVYAFRDRQRLMYLTLTPIFIGGALAVSKVFLLGAVPLIAWQVWRTARSKLMPILVIIAAGIGIAQTRLLANWSGAEYLQRLIRPNANAGYIDFYTAGRLGGSSTLTGVTQEVQEKSPILGFGARGLAAAYDNAWVEALVVAGFVGAILYTVVLVLILLIPRTVDGPQRRLAWGLALLTVAASVGLPALTANRSGMVLCVLLAILTVRKPVQDPLTMMSGMRVEAPVPRAGVAPMGNRLEVR